jgi:hypothetical protein
MIVPGAIPRQAVNCLADLIRINGRRFVWRMFGACFMAPGGSQGDLQQATFKAYLAWQRPAKCLDSEFFARRRCFAPIADLLHK